VHVVRLGGRHRLDASRVFSTGRSQDLLVTERALARKKSVATPDAGRGWTEGETVRVCRISYKSSCAWSVGFGLQILDTMEGVLGLLPVLLSPAGRRGVLRLAGQHRITIREERDVGQHIGRQRIADSGVPASDTGTSEVDTVR